MREPIFSYRITDYDRSILPSRFLAFLDESVRSPADWILRTGRSLGHPGWGLLYHMILSVLKPDEDNLVVETGTNLGSTTIIAAQAIRDSFRSGLIKTIEIDEDIASEASKRFELAGVANLIELLVGDSLKVLPEILESEGDVRLAFLDGNHFHDHVVREFELVVGALAEGGIVVFDNTYEIAEGTEDPRVNGALKTIVDRFGGNVVNLPICSWYTPGIAIWQRQPFADMEPPVPGSFVPET